MDASRSPEKTEAIAESPPAFHQILYRKESSETRTIQVTGGAPTWDVVAKNLRNLTGSEEMKKLDRSAPWAAQLHNDPLQKVLQWSCDPRRTHSGESAIPTENSSEADAGESARNSSNSKTDERPRSEWKVKPAGSSPEDAIKEGRGESKIKFPYGPSPSDQGDRSKGETIPSAAVCVRSPGASEDNEKTKGMRVNTPIRPLSDLSERVVGKPQETPAGLGLSNIYGSGPLSLSTRLSRTSGDLKEVNIAPGGRRLSLAQRDKVVGGTMMYADGVIPSLGRRESADARIQNDGSSGLFAFAKPASVSEDTYEERLGGSKNEASSGDNEERRARETYFALTESTSDPQKCKVKFGYKKEPKSEQDREDSARAEIGMEKFPSGKTKPSGRDETKSPTYDSSAQNTGTLPVERSSNLGAVTSTKISSCPTEMQRTSTFKNSVPDLVPEKEHTATSSDDNQKAGQKSVRFTVTPVREDNLLGTSQLAAYPSNKSSFQHSEPLTSSTLNPSYPGNAPTHPNIISADSVSPKLPVSSANTPTTLAATEAQMLPKDTIPFPKSAPANQTLAEVAPGMSHGDITIHKACSFPTSPSTASKVTPKEEAVIFQTAFSTSPTKISSKESTVATKDASFQSIPNITSKTVSREKTNDAKSILPETSFPNISIRNIPRDDSVHTAGTVYSKDPEMTILKNTLSSGLQDESTGPKGGSMKVDSLSCLKKPKAGTTIPKATTFQVVSSSASKTMLQERPSIPQLPLPASSKTSLEGSDNCLKKTSVETNISIISKMPDEELTDPVGDSLRPPFLGHSEISQTQTTIPQTASLPDRSSTTNKATHGDTRGPERTPLQGTRPTSNTPKPLYEVTAPKRCLVQDGPSTAPKFSHGVATSANRFPDLFNHTIISKSSKEEATTPQNTPSENISASNHKSLEVPKGSLVRAPSPNTPKSPDTPKSSYTKATSPTTLKPPEVPTASPNRVPFPTSSNSAEVPENFPNRATSPTTPKLSEGPEASIIQATSPTTLESLEVPKFSPVRGISPTSPKSAEVPEKSPTRGTSPTSPKSAEVPKDSPIRAICPVSTKPSEVPPKSPIQTTYKTTSATTGLPETAIPICISSRALPATAIQTITSSQASSSATAKSHQEGATVSIPVLPSSTITPNTSQPSTAIETTTSTISPKKVEQPASKTISDQTASSKDKDPTPFSTTPHQPKPTEERPTKLTRPASKPESKTCSKTALKKGPQTPPSKSALPKDEAAPKRQPASPSAGTVPQRQPANNSLVATPTSTPSSSRQGSATPSRRAVTRSKSDAGEGGYRRLLTTTTRKCCAERRSCEARSRAPHDSAFSVRDVARARSLPRNQSQPHQPADRPPHMGSSASAASNALSGGCQSPSAWTTQLALEAEVQQLKRELQMHQAEELRLHREIHKLRSVLQQATSFGEETKEPGDADDGALLVSLQERHGMAGASGLQGGPTKKQGVSGESSELNSAESIQVVRHEKDLRSRQLIKSAILDNDFLKNLAKCQIRELVDCMYPQRVQRGSYVIREGEAGSHLYVLAEGEMEVLKEGTVLGRMGPGKAFGELAILYNCTRTASIRAVSDLQVWVLDRRAFQQIMMRTGMQRLEDNIAFLRSVPLLQGLSEQTFARIADVLEPEFYPADEYIVRQGARGNTFFIISRGSVEVTQRGQSGVEVVLRTLERGEYFGEQALLHDDCRTASVRALPPGVDCLTLDRESFNALIGSLSELHHKDYAEDSRSHPSRPPSSLSNINDIRKDEETVASLRLEDLQPLGTLGVGGFGCVRLVMAPNGRSYALKSLSKRHVAATGQQEHVAAERDILLAARCPFIVRLYRTFRDDTNVYLLLEACLGGEVWAMLRDLERLPDKAARFVSACVLEALEYLHARDIVYRDLKPENLVMDANGYVKLVDFGFCKRLPVGCKTWTFCGTPEYVAPEVILNRGHDRAVDYWALGILIFELLTGAPPFAATDPMATYNLILLGMDSAVMPKYMSIHATHLIRRLCRATPSDRLGCQRGGFREVKAHRWFQDLDWDALRAQTMTPPFQPIVSGPADLSNFFSQPFDEDLAPAELSHWDANF